MPTTRSSFSQRLESHSLKTSFRLTSSPSLTSQVSSTYLRLSLGPLIRSPAGSALLATTYASPLSTSPSLSSARPVFPASYVTSTTGTGLVHTAPAHGMEDWDAWRAFQTLQNPSQPLSNVLCAVDHEGNFSDVLDELVDPEVKERLVGKAVLSDGTAAVIELLKERGTLLKEVEVQHKYPYDWRTKKPVIFRSARFTQTGGVGEN